MTPIQLQDKLVDLLALPNETEWVEFKHNNTDPIARYKQFERINGTCLTKPELVESRSRFTPS